MSKLSNQPPEEFKHRVLEWRDKYVSRIERDMTGNFPRLEKSLNEALETHWKMIFKSKPKVFTEEIIQPEIENWVESVTIPIQREAEKELTSVVSEFSDVLPDDFSVSNIQILAIPIASLLVGIGAVIAAFYLSTLVTGWGIFANPVIGLPAAAAIVAAGVLVAAGGAERVARTKSRIANAFTKKFLPRVKECLIGAGYEDDEGTHQPSVKVQIQEAYEQAANKLLSEIEN